jgi:hypothetical protein
MYALYSIGCNWCLTDAWVALRVPLHTAGMRHTEHMHGAELLSHLHTCYCCRLLLFALADWVALRSRDPALLEFVSHMLPCTLQLQSTV